VADHASPADPQDESACVGVDPVHCVGVVGEQPQPWGGEAIAPQRDTRQARQTAQPADSGEFAPPKHEVILAGI
jgi:hypothetical protein